MKNKGPVESDLNKHHARFEDPLWDEDFPVSKIIRIYLDNQKENIKDYQWKFFENDNLLYSLSGNSLNKKQIKFLQSYEGIMFLLTQYKQNGINVCNLKKELKNVINNRERK